MTEELTRKIMELLGSDEALRKRELARRLTLRGAQHKQLGRLLDKLVASGRLEQRRGAYRLARGIMVEGQYSATDRGYGFVAVEGRRDDLLIPARSTGSAMDGDQVKVVVRRSPRDHRDYGEITEVVTRAHSRMVGTYQQQSSGALVLPQGIRQARPVRVRSEAGIVTGDMVIVAIEQFPRGEEFASGRILERLGASDDPQTDIAAVIHAKKLPHAFSPAAIKEAEATVQQIDADDLSGRVDLCEVPLVTIDGETARDFDDAVAVVRESDGYKLWVAIADVAHYVTPDSALDQDALERGTSVYFPGFVLPMLPEALSNGICSLNPQVDRLVMAAELRIDSQGEVRDARFYEAVMNSRARLTYTQVAGCLNGEEGAVPAPLGRQLQVMDELAAILTQRRNERGSLDLDISETEIRVDESGRPIDVVKIERNRAHRLIEELMLIANQAVARYLAKKGRTFLYRVHDAPDQQKLDELQQLAAACGHGFVLGKDLHAALQNLLHDVAGEPEGRLINEQLLRSLQQAVYSPHNIGHFGLAIDDYCHFTSPIRRYPDLQVHRELKLALAGAPEGSGLSIPRLEQLGASCSAQERRAMEAERDLKQLRCCQIMQGRIGEEFSGIVVSVVEFGLFIELDDLLIEGLVHIRAMQGDYYHFDPMHRTLTGERRRQQFHIGMPVRVKVEKVDTIRRRIDFSLVEQPSASSGSAGKKKDI